MYEAETIYCVLTLHKPDTEYCYSVQKQTGLVYYAGEFTSDYDLINIPETVCPNYCFDCAKEIKGGVVILKKLDYMRLKQFGTSGCACETDSGKIVELCCAHEEYYQDKLTPLQNALYSYEHDVKWNGKKEDSMKELLKAVKELLEETKP